LPTGLDNEGEREGKASRCFTTIAFCFRSGDDNDDVEDQAEPHLLQDGYTGFCTVTSPFPCVVRVTQLRVPAARGDVAWEMWRGIDIYDYLPYSTNLLYLYIYIYIYILTISVARNERIGCY